MERTILRSALYSIVAVCGLAIVAGLAEMPRRHRAGEEAVAAVALPLTMALAGLAASARQARA